MKENLYAIGKIRRCFGVKGELVVESMTAKADRFSQLEGVLIGNDGGEVRPHKIGIERARSQGKGIVVKLEGIDDRDHAQELLGCYLYVMDEDRIELPPHTYFIHDILGLKVEDEDGTSIGTVVNVLHLPGAHDVYVIRQRSKEFWIPSVGEIIRNIDLQKRVLKIHVIEGLLEPQ